MSDEDDLCEREKDTQSQKVMAFVAIIGLGVTIAIFLYPELQNIGANSVTLQTHTSQIASLQATVNNEQVALASIQTELASISQKLDDWQAVDQARMNAQK